MTSNLRLSYNFVLVTIATFFAGCYNLDVKNADGGDQPTSVDGRAGETARGVDRTAVNAQDGSSANEASLDAPTTPDLGGYRVDGISGEALEGDKDASGIKDVGLPVEALGLDALAADTSVADAREADLAMQDAPNAYGNPPDAPGPAPDAVLACTGACCQDSDCATCQSCSMSSHTCVSVISNDDPLNRCAGTCDATGACKSKKGQACSTVANGCASGTTCADGYCCDKECKGTCEACDVTPGTCTTLGSGATPRAGRTACTASDTTCAGKCDGNSPACFYTDVACGAAATCTTATYQPQGHCGAGACVVPAAYSCPTNQTCSSSTNACACQLSTCGTACVNLDSDPKNCGACGHDCLGGPCSGGYCRPYKLGDVATGKISLGGLVPDGAKVYAITQTPTRSDTSKVWQMDASTPGIPVKVPPDMVYITQCIIDGTMVWPIDLGTSGNVVFGYCSVSGCAASTRSFTHVGQTGATLSVYPRCDAANKEIVWAEQFTPTAGGGSTYNIIRSSVTGTNMRQMTSFPFENGATSAYMNSFPIGRSDQLIFTRTTGTKVELFSISTTTNNVAPVLLASGATGTPVDLQNGVTLANDNLLVWSWNNDSSYRVPLPNGVGTSTPPVFDSNYVVIMAGIIDNYHFYGLLTNNPSGMLWCSLPTCVASVLSTDDDFSLADPNSFTQDAGAIYWSVATASNDGFAIWKVAKQAY